MTWTYGGDPANSDRDAVRLLVGDTDTNDQQLTDEEVTYFLTEEGEVKRAAVRSARAIGARYARLVDKAVGDLRQSYSHRQRHYEDLATRLDREASVSTALVYAGGISDADKTTVEEDTDRVKPSFEREMHDHPGSTHADELRSDV